MFTSPSGLKSSGSLPPTPPSPRAFSPPIIFFFFPPLSLIWCQTSIYCTVLTRLEERVTSYLGARQTGLEEHPSKMLICWRFERRLTSLNSPSAGTWGPFYGPIRHPHGRLTADLVTRHLKPYEEGNLSLVPLFSSALPATARALRIPGVSAYSLEEFATD